MPFHIGLPEKHCITIKSEEDKKIISFLFRTYEYFLQKEKHFTSSVNMFLFDKELKDTKENLTISLSNAFDSLLDQLNMIIFSYKYVTRIPYIYEINVTDIDSMVFYGSKVGGARLKPLGLFLLDALNIKTKQEILNEKEFSEFTRIHNITTNNLNPFCDVKRTLLYASSLGTKRRYSEAILMQQTAFERMVYEIFKIVYPELYGEDYEDISFKRLITKYIPEKLGGNWNVAKGSRGTVSDYYNNFYMLRCKIIHKGYKPDTDEYHKVSRIMEEMLKFTTERIGIKKRQFPKLFQMVLEE